MLEIMNKTITMYEGDFGSNLLFNFTGGEIEENDVVKFIIKKAVNEDVLIEKEYSRIKENRIVLTFTNEDAKKLKKGSYIWGIKLYRGNRLVDTIIGENPLIIRKGV